MKQSIRINSGLPLVFLATIGWSFSGLFVRLLPGLDGWQINCWRGFWLAVSLGLYLIAKHRSKLRAEFAAVPEIAMLTSALCFAAGTTFYVSALTFESTATVAAVGATSPLITAMFSRWITGERPSPYIWLATFIALVGGSLIVYQKFAFSNIFGLALSFGVPATFAIQTLLLRRHRNRNMIIPICLGGVFAFLLAGIFSFTVGHGSVFALTSHEMLLLALMGSLQLAVPLILYAGGAKSVPAVTLSVVAMLDAVFNPLWTWLWAGESVDPMALAGSSVVLAGVALSVYAARDVEPSSYHYE